MQKMSTLISIYRVDSKTVKFISLIIFIKKEMIIHICLNFGGFIRQAF